MIAKSVLAVLLFQQAAAASPCIPDAVDFGSPESLSKASEAVFECRRSMPDPKDILVKSRNAQNQIERHNELQQTSESYRSVIKSGDEAIRDSFAKLEKDQKLDRLATLFSLGKTAYGLLWNSKLSLLKDGVDRSPAGALENGPRYEISPPALRQRIAYTIEYLQNHRPEELGKSDSGLSLYSALVMRNLTDLSKLGYSFSDLPTEQQKSLQRMTDLAEQAMDFPTSFSDAILYSPELGNYDYVSSSRDILFLELALHQWNNAVLFEGAKAEDYSQLTEVLDFFPTLCNQDKCWSTP